MTHSVHDINSLIDGLHSTDAASRSHARHHLVAIGRNAVSVLVKLLESPVQHVRWEAAKVLEGIADPDAVPALINALGDSDTDVAWVAGEALGAIGEEAVPALLRRLASKPQPGEQPSDRLYRGAHQVFDGLAKRRGDHRFDGLLKALQAEEAEIHVPLASATILEE
jgi:HEAT repeat protein